MRRLLTREWQQYLVFLMVAALSFIGLPGGLARAETAQPPDAKAGDGFPSLFGSTAGRLVRFDAGGGG
ncbi:MAG: hypothetical protein ACJ72W_30845 [Actinoallomurus sp.]